MVNKEDALELERIMFANCKMWLDKKADGSLLVARLYMWVRGCGVRSLLASTSENEIEDFIWWIRRLTQHHLIVKRVVSPVCDFSLCVYSTLSPSRVISSFMVRFYILLLYILLRWWIPKGSLTPIFSTYKKAWSCSVTNLLKRAFWLCFLTKFLLLDVDMHVQGAWEIRRRTCQAS